MRCKFYESLLNKKLILTLTLGLSICIASFSQTPQDFDRCGNDLQKMAAQYPEFMQAYNQFESNWELAKHTINFNELERSSTGKYIIPVVIHVLHLGGTENISASQCKSQITALNTLFGMESPGLSILNSFPAFDTVVPYFNGDDTCFVSGPGSQLLNRFEFRLATIDPLGNCTDGIVRTYTEKADNASDETRFKQTSYWDRAHYFNMWVIKSFPSASLLGYAQFPFSFGSQFPLTSTDGVALLHSVFGTNGTASGHTGATPAHEAGHWLGLFHIWGDADCGSDGIDDTPLHFGENFSGPGCFPLPKTATCYADTASTDSSVNAYNLMMRFQVGEQWMNFMDYTDDNCQYMFSEGQYRKMNVTMESIAFRGSLSSTTNQLATGTDDAAQASLCHAMPVADLWSRDGSNNFIVKKLICAGGDLTYRDGTHNLTNTGSDPATLAWDFPGGTPNTSTSSNPLIVYNTPGVYDATLTSTNADGADTKTRTGYVHVSSTVADESNYIYYDDFEYSTSLFEQGKWIIIGQGVDPANGWEQTSNTGYLSSKCMVMRNDGNIHYEQDFLITPSYDLTQLTNEKLYFKYAGARKSAMPWAIQKDQLQLYSSTNCGENWQSRPIKIDGVTRTTISGDTLYSAGLFPSGFVPTSPANWNEGEVDLAAINTQPNVRFMFVWTSGGSLGNDFYIDQINISNSTAIGIDEQQGQFAYNVYPNPLSGSGQVYFNIPEDSKVTVDAVDITGRVVKEIFNGNMKAGEQYLEIHNTDFYSSGVYFVRLNVNGVVATKKIIIEKY